MREAGYVQARLFNNDQIKQLNETVNKSLVVTQDNPSKGAIKSSQVEFVRYFSIQKLIFPFIDFIMTTNHHHYGFDLFPLTPSKTLNYNSYNVNEEYSWHIDATMDSPVRDIKLTCLLNCSEENYEGGDLIIFRDGEKKVENFSSGSAVVFPSFTNHKVEKIVSGSRKTLAIWMDGPKFR
mgnify:CR=1 FL=1|tara:strand:+ start:408 stop:947 length:540 start_codon:yes stop_codon:yes gene_type:complete